MGIAAGRTPFMAYIGTKAPHDPFDPASWYKTYWHPTWPTAAPRPPSWNMTKEQLANHHPTVASQSMLTADVAECIDSTFKDRWRCLMSVDDLIADVVGAVEVAGLGGSTYYLYSSDHGYQLGELNLPQDKRNVYEFDTKIHLLMRGPGVRPGSTWKQVASNVDIAPTILSLANIPKPTKMDGRSFLKFVATSASTGSLPESVDAYLVAEAVREQDQPNIAWRDTHYIKHNSVGAGNYPTMKLPNCKRRPRDTESPNSDDVHFVDQPDNNFIAIRHIGGVEPSSKYSRIYKKATSISSNFLYAEFQWNNIEQFPHLNDGSVGSGYNGSIPLKRHDGPFDVHAGTGGHSNNCMGGWVGGWENTSGSSPGNINFTQPFFFELFDMDADEFQMVNIYSRVNKAEPHVTAAMHAHVQSLHVCQGETCP